jgi:hypothetical protein
MSGPESMSQTKRIPREQLYVYFGDFTKRFLQDSSPEAVDVELIEPELGDQTVTIGTHLLGITYEDRTNTLEIEMETGDHRDYNPEAVWVVEEPDGFVNAFEIVNADGRREVVSVKRVRSRRID